MQKNAITGFVAGLLCALSLSLILVLLLAAIVRFTAISDGWIRPINQIIKIIAMLLGSFIAVKNNKGALKGMLFGLLYIILANLIFGIIAGKVEFNISFLWEILFGAAAGSLCGVISVNLFAKTA